MKMVKVKTLRVNVWALVLVMHLTESASIGRRRIELNFISHGYILYIYVVCVVGHNNINSYN